jgi:hypothetical protein
VPKVFASVDDSNLQQELAAANHAASLAVYQLRDGFIAQRKTANDGFAMGPTLFAAMVRETEDIDVPIAQIKKAGQSDLARNTAALRAACAAFAPGKSLKDCVAKEQADKPPEGTLVAARAQLARLREFFEGKHIASIPGNEQALVAEAPPYNRANFAYIVIAGPYEKNLPSVTTSHPRIRHGRKPSKRSTSLGGPNS